MIDRAALLLYVIWRAVLVALAFIGWTVGMVVGTLISGIVAGFMRGYKG